MLAGENIFLFMLFCFHVNSNGSSTGISLFVNPPPGFPSYVILEFVFPLYLIFWTKFVKVSGQNEQKMSMVIPSFNRFFCKPIC